MQPPLTPCHGPQFRTLADYGIAPPEWISSRDAVDPGTVRSALITVRSSGTPDGGSWASSWIAKGPCGNLSRERATT